MGIEICYHQYSPGVCVHVRAKLNRIRLQKCVMVDALLMTVPLHSLYMEGDCH